MASIGFSPASVRVLVVDDNIAALKNLQTILKDCKYKVKTCNLAKKACYMLEENNEFDMVISNVNMKDMNGYKFLSRVTAMNIPLIMMIDDEETNKVMEGIRRGACHCLLKPIETRDVEFIWQYIYLKRMDQIKGSKEDSHTVAGNKRKKLAENSDKSGGECGGDPSSSAKKPKLSWTVELNEKFEKAVEQIVKESGEEEVRPKRILKLMGVRGLTRYHVSSHLQKYLLKKAAASKVSGTNIYFQQSTPMLLRNMDRATVIGGQKNSPIHNQLVANHANPYQEPDAHFQNFPFIDVQNEVLEVDALLADLSLPSQNVEDISPQNQNPSLLHISGPNIKAFVPPDPESFDWTQFLDKYLN